MRKIILLLVCLNASIFLSANDYAYKFRLTLKDKAKSEYKIDKPEKILSQKAIDRRNKHGIKIDVSDLPISYKYIKSIEKTGAIVVAKSKWMNTVSVHVEDSAAVEILKALPFVEKAELVWRSKAKKKPAVSADTILVKESVQFEDRTDFPHKDDYYGFAEDNIKLVNGHYLHQAGFKGEGIDVAVIDAGFSNYPIIKAFDNIKIKENKRFVYEHPAYPEGMEKWANVYEKSAQHGMNVLSCMAINQPNYFVGTAPEANYYLLASEDESGEFPIEEDYWTAAIEYADSLGIDVVNTSLGYNDFNEPIPDYTHADLDGRTAFISRAANMAVKKGIFVCTSAGNSGADEWQKLTPPGDAVGTLTVGAMQADSLIASFSSKGFTADMRIKPDIVALGYKTNLIGDNGKETQKNGTSFSTPVMCGLVACLWQAYPELTNLEILQVIKKSANRAEFPDNSYGFGIPDMKKAMEFADVLKQSKLSKKKK